jgi:hypothetical protein
MKVGWLGVHHTKIGFVEHNNMVVCAWEVQDGSYIMSPLSVDACFRFSFYVHKKFHKEFISSVILYFYQVVSYYFVAFATSIETLSFLKIQS